MKLTNTLKADIEKLFEGDIMSPDLEIYIAKRFGSDPEYQNIRSDDELQEWATLKLEFYIGRGGSNEGFRKRNNETDERRSTGEGSS